jgi:poly(A) polymerase
VSTFRSSPEPPEAPNDAEGWEHSEDVAEETVEPDIESMYGTPDQDALRRDFTVNALFYDISDFSIVDYVGGLADLEQRVLRTIGDPAVRFAEDPVRMLRALEYSVRLDFRLEERTAAAIAAGHSAITEAAPARLAYELLETLRSGHAAGIIDAWQRVGLLGEAFPVLGGDHQQRIALLDTVDQRHRLGATFADATLFGALFLPQFLDLLSELDAPDGRLNRGLLLERLTTLLAEAGARVHLSNHVVHQMGQAMFALAKMRRPPERGRQVVKLARQSYFSVAWDLLSLAGAVGLASRDVVQAWGRAVERFRSGENVEVEAPPSDDAAEAPAGQRRRRRPRRRRRG